MPSRRANKKKKGPNTKAKKAKQDALAKGAKDEDEPLKKREAAMAEILLPLDYQISLLRLKDDLRNNFDECRCRHGLSQMSSTDACVQFYAEFWHRMVVLCTQNVAEKLDKSIHSVVQEAESGALTAVPGAWTVEVLEWFTNACWAYGVERILEKKGNDSKAEYRNFIQPLSLVGLVANRYDTLVAAMKNSSAKSFVDAKSQLIDLIGNDESTIVRFFKKNCPCNCLAAKHRELKSTTVRMSRCSNMRGHCEVTRPRTDMMVCSRCKSVHYCSRACQVEDWRAGHKEMCECIDLLQNKKPGLDEMMEKLESFLAI